MVGDRRDLTSKLLRVTNKGVEAGNREPWQRKREVSNHPVNLNIS